MNSRQTTRIKIRNLPVQGGMSLLETMIAIAVLLIATLGIMTLALVATATTENQGHLAARTTEYAQDKMEQLLSLAYGDSTTDTTVFPAVNTGGTGLAVGGSSNPATPVTTPGTGYVDYLDLSGNPVTGAGGAPPANWYYMRVWQISVPAGTTNMFQITVTTKVRTAVGGTGGVGALPQSTVTTLKTKPF
jgi:type II secretory pathway pseudopilin PulG